MQLSSNGIRTQSETQVEPRILRKELFDAKKCLFCQKRSNTMKLSQISMQLISNSFIVLTFFNFILRFLQLILKVKLNTFRG